jgi:hypothetical protein
MAMALGHRLNVLRFEAARAAGRAVVEKLPEGKPLAEPRTEVVRPGMFVPEQLERVTRCAFNTGIEAELALLTQTERRSSPPRAVEFRNAAVFGGQIFAGGRRHMLSRTPPHHAALGPVRECDEVVLAQSYQGCTVFGHWLMDDCAMRELPIAEGHDLAISRPAWPDCARYEGLFGQTWDAVPAFTARRLTVLREIGFSADKAERQRRLRARVRRELKPGPGGILYLARGPSGVRRTMLNEAELCRRLEAAGIEIVQCESGIDTMMARCLDARLILGIEGSQLCHAIYMLAEGGAVMAIQPPDRFCTAHHEWSRQLGMLFGTVVGRQAEGGWTADPDEVLAMVDALLEAAA